MKISPLILVGFVFLLTGSAAIGAEPTPGRSNTGGVIDLEGVQKEYIRSRFLEVACNVPSVQPMLTPLTRSWSPDREKLIKLFFGGQEGVTGTEDVISPIWGKGKRYKSSTQIVVSRNAELGVRQFNMSTAQEIEVIPVYLDVYSSGFVYANNVPHKAVLEVKLNNNKKASYSKLYSEKEGQQAAEALIEEMIGQLGVPTGFQESVKVQVEDYGEKLFRYYARPEYLTEFNVTEIDSQGKEKVIGKQPVSVPVYDAKVDLKLDGDKLLCGMEFFWDGAIKTAGTPKECISAFTAVVNAREALLKHFNDEPPLLTVSDIRIGYVHNRKDQKKLIPVWMFDAWYTQNVDPSHEPPLGAPRPSADVIEIAFPFAIDALSGELILLSPYQ